jgi:hypothetical protein
MIKLFVSSPLEGNPASGSVRHGSCKGRLPEKPDMSQRDVEKLLGKILTDDEFRQSFFPVGRRSFEFAAHYGLELTPIERSALSSLRSRAFECLARSLDPRISRSSAAGETIAARDEGGF